jgi:succinate-semialdehyde dehydrogenase/glutarate-semialdehyde dehydrogenase
MSYQSINPNNGKVLQTFDYISEAQLDTSLAGAESCFQGWKKTSYQDRAAIVRKAASLLRANVNHFATLATLETGKRIDEARGEVLFSADILDYYAEHAEQFLQPVKLNPKAGTVHMESSPLGVLFCIEPWNFPYYQLARVAGAQLMVGNVIMVKHAACVPQCAIAFEKLWIDAGAPSGLYSNLLITHEQSDIVIDDPRIKGVALTGSVAAGKVAAARAGQGGCSARRAKSEEVLDGTRWQRCLHRARRCRSRQDDSLGGVGPDVQRRPDLLRSQTVHCARLDR